MNVENTQYSEGVQGEIERLQEWLKKQPHLPQDIGDTELEAFVRGTKSLEIAKKKLDSYYSIRGRVPQLFDFSNRDPLSPAFQEASKAFCMYFLPKPTPEGYRVLIMRLEEDFSTFSHQQKIARTLMMIELAMLTWPNMKGFIFCYDMKHAPGNFISKLSISLGSVGIHWFQSSVPMKLKVGLLINAPSFFSIIVNKLAKPLLSAKLFERIVISDEGEEALKKYIPKELLPSDYGGDEKSSDLLNEYWLNMLKEKREWFMKTSGQVTSEERRPPDSEDAFGVQGTFRSLSFD